MPSETVQLSVCISEPTGFSLRPGIPFVRKSRAALSPLLFTMKKFIKENLWVRIVISVLCAAFACVFALFVYKFGTMAPCIFHKLTGLYCPGCGTGRAVGALLHLDIIAAVRYNVLFVVFLPFVIYCLMAFYLHFLVGRSVIPIPKVHGGVAVAVLVVIVAYAVLRNIPIFPFTLLAPH